jgi:hypothetical protein
VRPLKPFPFLFAFARALASHIDLDMTFGLDGIANWILRTSVLRDARRAVAASAGGADAARRVGQARLLVEVAARVIEPTHELPAGSRAAVALSLYRDAVYWMLAAQAGFPDGGPSGPDGPAVPTGLAAAPSLDALWSAAMPPATLLEAAGGDPAALAALRQVLVGLSPPLALGATPGDVEHVRAFVESLVWLHDRPRRALAQAHWQRWTRLGLVVAVIVLVVAGGRKLTLGRNWAEGRPFRTSSSHPSCQPHDCADLLFHTLVENDPWVEIDLGQVRSIHRIDIANRSDCCAERAVPLVAEVSLDDRHWNQVARREAEFSTWTARFPTRPARYVRLHVPRETALHLEGIAVR